MYFKIKFWGGFFSWNQSDISPDPKGQVAVEFPFCQHLMLAPGETVGIPCSLCDTIVRPRPTMTIVTCVVIHKAVTYGLLVTKFHLQTIVKIIFGTTQTQFVELERQKKNMEHHSISHFATKLWTDVHLVVIRITSITSYMIVKAQSSKDSWLSRTSQHPSSLSASHVTDQLIIGRIIDQNLDHNKVKQKLDYKINWIK